MATRRSPTRRKLTGHLVGAAEARSLLSRNGMDPARPEHQRFLRIAGAYFAFDIAGSHAMRDQLLGQCLREMAKRESEAVASDRGRIKQRRDRRATMYSQPWLAEFVRVFQLTRSKTAAARAVMTKYKPVDDAGKPLNAPAIRERARRAQVLPTTPRRRKQK